jgi:hypothetical protein
MRVFERAMRTHPSACRSTAVAAITTGRGRNLVEQFGGYVFIQVARWWALWRKLCRTSRRCKQGVRMPKYNDDDNEVGYIETYEHSRVQTW